MKMRTSSVLFTGLIAALAGFAIAGEKDVVELTDADFDARIAEHDTVLVMFYAPWCGHCKRLKPEYAKAAEDLARNDPPVVLAKVDCTEGGKDTCNTYSVSGYPTLKIFRNGEMTQEYAGPREAPGIVKYMRAQVGPASKELASLADLDRFLSADKEIAVVGFFKAETDAKATFLRLADRLREKVRFGHSTHSDVIEREAVSDGIVLYRPEHLKNKFEPSRVVFEGTMDVSELTSWIEKTRHGLVGHRRSENRGEFANPLIVAYYSVDYERNAKGTNYWRNRILKVAEKYADKDVRFAVASKDDFQHELNEYGVDFVKGDKPQVFARDASNRKYIMSEEFTMESLARFVDDLLDGKLEPYLKSEPVPDSQDGPVKVAVAKNFDELVVNSGRDALVEFYAPWCGHCKKLTPAYEELATKLSGEAVDIVKMDATANDVPAPFDVRGFPTLYWAPKDKKSAPVRYEGGREADDFLRYIAEHASEELAGWDRKGNAKKTEL